MNSGILRLDIESTFNGNVLNTIQDIQDLHHPSDYVYETLLGELNSGPSRIVSTLDWPESIISFIACVYDFVMHSGVLSKSPVCLYFSIEMNAPVLVDRLFKLACDTTFYIVDVSIMRCYYLFHLGTTSSTPWQYTLHPPGHYPQLARERSGKIVRHRK